MEKKWENYEVLHNLYRSPNRVIKSRRLRWASHIARMEKRRSLFKFLTAKLTGKRTLGRPILIRMYFKEIFVNKRNLVESDHIRDYWRVLLNGVIYAIKLFTIQIFNIR